MLHRYGWVVVLGALMVPGAMVARGSGEERVDLSAALEVWMDVLRDVDALGTHMFRVSDADEMALGESLVGSAESTSDRTATAYVQAVLAPLAEHVRRSGISYSAHVVDLPFVNAWAMPGGHVYVTTEMLSFLHSEAELAAVIGHEIAHVDQRHCIDRYEYQLRLSRAGLEGAGALVDTVRQMAATGYSKYQEAEADVVGLGLMIDAGYDPQASVDAMRRLAALEGDEGVARRAGGIAGETGRVTVEALATFLASHPEPSTRADRLAARMHAERRRIVGRPFYMGVDNLMRRVPRAREWDAAEVKSYP
jgi:predicted Zn-dependent protease